MKQKAVLAAAVSLVFLLPIATYALGLQTVVPSDCNQQGGCQSICDLALLAQNVFNDGIYIAIFLSAILFAWAGWQMIVGSSSGNAAQVKRAKDVFWYVIVGLVLIISAWTIVNIIMAALTNNSNWNALCDYKPSAIARTIPSV